MPRVIVTADPSPVPRDDTVWLDEQVLSVHLSTGHAAAQFLERLAWAISDAEDADNERADRRAQSRRPPRPHVSSTRPRGQRRVRA